MDLKMNNRIIQIFICFLGLVALTNTSCREDDELYYDIIVKNETSNYLCLLTKISYDNQPYDFVGVPHIDYIEPSGLSRVDVISNREIDNLIDHVCYQIDFIEAVNPKEINITDILSRAVVSSDFKIKTKFYTLKELRAMDWTIVYDGSLE